MPNQTHHQNEMPHLTPDRNVEAGVEDTFPASDPSSSTASQGARAVPPEDIMDSAAGACAKPGECVEVNARVRDREAAKLALESLVREGPLDRRHAEIRAVGDQVTLHFQAPTKDAPRLEALVQQQGGATAS